MLEIILLIQLTKSIARIAERKGLKPGTWKLYVILAWFGSEFFFGFIAYWLFTNDLYSAILTAYLCALGSYFVVRAVLKNKPDAIKDEWIEQIGQPETTELPAQQSF
jgi:hypothetical protein